MKTEKLDAHAAEQIAIDCLGFVAADAELLGRFLAMSGIDAGAIRRAAREPGFLAGVLNFVVAHEPTLLKAAGATQHSPDHIVRAVEMLPLGQTRYERST